MLLLRRKLLLKYLRILVKTETRNFKFKHGRSILFFRSNKQSRLMKSRFSLEKRNERAQM